MLSDATRITATDDFGASGSAQRDLARKRATAMNMQASGRYTIPTRENLDDFGNAYQQALLGDTPLLECYVSLAETLINLFAFLSRGQQSILGTLSDAMIDDLIIPTSESIGARLLKRMGWKPGQGIGPRVSRRQRNPTASPLSDEDIAANVTFAPIDSAIILFANKSNHFGLGFNPHKDAPEFDVSAHAQSGMAYLICSLRRDITMQIARVYLDTASIELFIIRFRITIPVGRRLWCHRASVKLWSVE